MGFNSGFKGLIRY